MKALLTVFFDCNVVVHHVFLPQGRIIIRNTILKLCADCAKHKTVSDLAPVHFFLFPKLKTPTKGKRFATIEVIKEKSKPELLAIPKSASQNCFEDWKKRWHKLIIIISEEGYFEGDKIVVDK